MVETIALKLKANLNEVTVEISSVERKIGMLKIKGVNTEITIKSTYTQIEAKLQDLMIIDHNQNTKHPQIIHCIDKYALTAQVVIYNIEPSMMRSTDINMSIHVKLGKLRIVFLNYFIKNTLVSI